MLFCPPTAAAAPAEVSAWYTHPLAPAWEVSAEVRGELGPVGLRAAGGFDRAHLPSLTPDLAMHEWHGQLGAGPRRFTASGAEWMPWGGFEVGHNEVDRGWDQVLAQDDWFTARWLTWGGLDVGLVGVVPIGRRFAFRTDDVATADRMWYRGNHQRVFSGMLGFWTARLRGRNTFEWRPTDGLSIGLGFEPWVAGWPFHAFGIGAMPVAGLTVGGR